MHNRPEWDLFIFATLEIDRNAREKRDFVAALDGSSEVI